MIEITERIWIGVAKDEREVDLAKLGIAAILNVAQDMQGTRGWAWRFEAAHVGLIDGPGNPLFAYSAAILTLHTLLDRHDKVMVFCHNGGRSLAVVLMYLILKRGKGNTQFSTFLSCWTTWDGMLEYLKAICGPKLPTIHAAHKEAFEKLSLSLLEGLI